MLMVEDVVGKNFFSAPTFVTIYHLAGNILSDFYLWLEEFKSQTNIENFTFLILIESDTSKKQRYLIEDGIYS